MTTEMEDCYLSQFTEGLKMLSGKQRQLAIGSIYVLLSVLPGLELVTSPLRAQPADWTDYRSPDHKFSAKFPGSVDVSHREPNEKGISVSSFTASHASCTFRIDDYNYPANVFSPRNDFVDWFIDDSQSSDLKALSATLLAGTAHPVILNKILGREFMAESNQFALAERIYITDVAPNAFDEFSLKVLCPNGRENDTLASSFLNSFQTLGGAEVTISIDRDGLWRGKYTLPESSLDLDVANITCSPRKLTMLVDGLNAKISVSARGDLHFSPFPQEFSGSLDPQKKRVTASTIARVGRIYFWGEFSSDGTLIGSYDDGPCSYSVSLRRELQVHVEEVAPQDTPPEVRQYLPLMAEMQRCMDLDALDERMYCLEAFAKEHGVQVEIQK
jgi:hypothetical protein